MPKKINKPAVSNANTDRKAAIAKAAATIKAADTQLLATTALSSSTSRFDLCRKALAFIGKAGIDSPVYAARHAAARRSIGIGYLAGRFRRDGDNRDDEALLTYAADVYGRAAWDSERVADGQLRCDGGEADGPETKARTAMRVYLSGIFGEAGIKAPASSGGGNNGAEKRAAAKAKALKEAKANPSAVIANIKSETAQAAIKALVSKSKAQAREASAFAPDCSDAEAFTKSIQRVAVAFLQSASKLNAKTNGAIKPHILSALEDFKTAVTK